MAQHTNPEATPGPFDATVAMFDGILLAEQTRSHCKDIEGLLVQHGIVRAMSFGDYGICQHAESAEPEGPIISRPTLYQLFRRHEELSPGRHWEFDVRTRQAYLYSRIEGKNAEDADIGLRPQSSRTQLTNEDYRDLRQDVCHAFQEAKCNGTVYYSDDISKLQARARWRRRLERFGDAIARCYVIDPRAWPGQL